MLVALTPESIENARWSPHFSAGKLSPVVFKAQVWLDRAGFSPGEIDAHGGENFDKARSVRKGWVAQHAARICEAHIVDIAIADNRVFRIAASFGKLGRLSSGETAPLFESFAALNAHLLECCRRRI